MVSSETRRNYEPYCRLVAAFRSGDMAALRAELGSLNGFPNVVAHPAMGDCLTCAIYHSPIGMVRDLLDAGADPNKPNDDGFPPLIAALTCAVPAPSTSVRTDVTELLELLLAYGAEVAQRGINDYTPLHLAAEQGDLRNVDILLAHGADPNEITRIDDMETPMDLAAKAGYQAVVDRLRPLTIRPNWERASETGDIAIAAQMLRAGHDINARDGYGQTAIMRAAHAGRREMVDWLIAQGADLDHTSKFRLTALMLAVISGHAPVAYSLAKAGADTAVTGSGAPGFAGKTAADLAEARGDTCLAAFLRTHRPRMT